MWQTQFYIYLQILKIPDSQNGEIIKIELFDKVMLEIKRVQFFPDRDVDPLKSHSRVGTFPTPVHQ